MGILSGVTTILPQFKNLKETTINTTTNMIKFRPTGKIVNDGWPDIRNKKMNWGRSSIRMSFSYEEGFIKTKKGTDVLAYRFIDDSLKLELFNRDTNGLIQKPASYLNNLNLTYPTIVLDIVLPKAQFFFQTQLLF